MRISAIFPARVSKESQSAVAKSDYCATYVHTNGEKNKGRKHIQEDGESRLDRWPVKVQKNHNGGSENAYRVRVSY